MAVAGAALRLRLLYRMLRVGELLALVVFLSWSSSRVPSAAAAVLRFAGSLLLNARFVFVLGNAIVLMLLALSRHDLSISSNHAAASGSSSATTAAPAAASFPSFVAPQPSPPPPPRITESPAPAAAVPCRAAAAAAVFEDKQQAVRCFNKARAPRRSRSEKMGPRAAIRRAASPELRRSESENGRRRRSSVTARDAEACWGMDDAEEFRRTVEEFIAKQTRFHREESMTMAIVPGVGHGEVAPAIAGALTVVE